MKPQTPSSPHQCPACEKGQGRPYDLTHDETRAVLHMHCPECGHIWQRPLPNHGQVSPDDESA